MECSGKKRKKRKGVDISTECQNDVGEENEIVFLWSHLSLKDYSRRKKCKEIEVSGIVDIGRNVVDKVVTAPTCGATSFEVAGRGLKRKIGCIDAATWMGRKKKIGQEYDLIKAIGRGKFGSVMLCRNKATGEEFACKTLQKGEEIVHREVEIMQHLSGYPGVVTLRSVYEDDESVHLVMELCSGGRLVDQMSREGMYSEQKAANILKELMLAIRYCHEMGVVHRDIKPENVLLTSSGQMKLADFGLAVRIQHGQRLSGVVGSPAYVAPEVLEGKYSEEVDIWSAGVLLHALLVGALPFQGDSLKTVFGAIKKDQLDFNGGIWDSISQLARDLLSGMMTRDASKRLTANEVLKHPWISFYTESTLKTSEPRPNKLRPTSRLLTHIRRTESERKRTLSHEAPVVDSSPISLTSSSSTDATGIDDDCSLVDVLTVAISCVRISEPKRSRVCSPSRTIQLDCSSNLKTNNLCTAF